MMEETTASRPLRVQLTPRERGRAKIRALAAQERHEVHYPPTFTEGCAFPSHSFTWDSPTSTGEPFDDARCDCGAKTWGEALETLGAGLFGPGTE